MIPEIMKIMTDQVLKKTGGKKITVNNGIDLLKAVKKAKKGDVIIFQEPAYPDPDPRDLPDFHDTTGMELTPRHLYYLRALGKKPFPIEGKGNKAIRRCKK